MFMDENYDNEAKDTTSFASEDWWTEYNSARRDFDRQLRIDSSKPEPVLSYQNEVIEEEQVDLRSLAKLHPHKEEKVLDQIDDEMFFLATQKDISSLDFKAKHLSLEHHMRKLCNSSDNPYEYRAVLAKYMSEKEAPSILEVKLTNRIMMVNDVATSFHVDCIDLAYFGLAGLFGKRKAIQFLGDLLLMKLKSKPKTSILGEEPKDSIIDMLRSLSGLK